MTRKKAYLIAMALLMTLLTVLLCAAAIRIWREGSARKAENPLEAVYTPEKVEEELLRISPLLYAVIGMAAAGLLLGIRDEKNARPSPAPEAARKQRQETKGGRSPRIGEQPSDRGTNAVRIALLLAAGALMVLGAMNGSMEDVLRKAINICTECIGLG